MSHYIKGKQNVSNTVGNVSQLHNLYKFIYLYKHRHFLFLTSWSCGQFERGIGRYFQCKNTHFGDLYFNVLFV